MDMHILKLIRLQMKDSSFNITEHRKCMNEIILRKQQILNL